MTTRLFEFETRRYHRIDPQELGRILGVEDAEKHATDARRTLQQATAGSADEAMSRFHRAAWRWPWMVTPVSQWRKQFVNIGVLANDIAERGLINPLVVAVWTRQECERYIAAVNLLWGTSHTIHDLPSTSAEGEERFLVLIAGERRLRACRRLWDHGCDKCLKEYGEEAPGACFKRHLPDGIKVDERLGLTPYEALSLQYAENSYEPPNYDEQAVGYKLYYELLRVIRPELSVAEYSRIVGRKAGLLRQMLRYCDLPESVRSLVRDGQMPYTTALLFDRYVDIMFSDAELEYWLKVATEESPTSKVLAERMSRARKDLKVAQTGLFATTTLEVLQERRHRAIFDATIARFLQRMEGFLSRAVTQYEHDGLGQPHSPFAEWSVIRSVLYIYSLLTILVPHISRSMTRRQREEMRAARLALAPRIRRLRRKLEATNRP